MDLHYSQTIATQRNLFTRFTTLWIYTILKPIWHWRICPISFTTLWIYTILKQLTGGRGVNARFTTLWIYTILKQVPTICLRCLVLLPYGFTLFSNASNTNFNSYSVLLPYGFTLFSNGKERFLWFRIVLLPYGFTLFSNYNPITNTAFMFYYLMDLHYSQT